MEKPLKSVEIYTDGACSGNPGPGGWAAILRFGAHEKTLSGSMPRTTNNRMEVFAVISGVGALKERCRVRVYSDSTYVVNAFEKGWLANWQRNGWKTAEGKPVENQDLWRLMAIIAGKHDIAFIKVPGHAACEGNNRCDQIAREEIKRLVALNPDIAQSPEK